MIPCVVLASVPRPGAAAQEQLKFFKKEYYDFQPGVIRQFPYRVELRPANSNDGGNGGGGEPGGAPMRPCIGALEKTFWDFKIHPPAHGRVEAYPEELRFEICLHFEDLGYAAAWLQLHPAGQRLGRIFTYVQIVALSTPAFVGTILNNQWTDGYRAPAYWIGT